ncbi:hypothetical protein GGI22_003204, partial [Coemansia erecta]
MAEEPPPPQAIIQRTEQTMLDSTQPSGENGLQSFRIHGRRTYTQQFDQLYYKRLDDLKPV